MDDLKVILYKAELALRNLEFDYIIKRRELANKFHREHCKIPCYRCTEEKTCLVKRFVDR